MEVKSFFKLSTVGIQVELPSWAGESFSGLMCAMSVVGHCSPQADCAVFSDSVVVNVGETEDEFRRPAVLKTVTVNCMQLQT